MDSSRLVYDDQFHKSLQQVIMSKKLDSKVTRFLQYREFHRNFICLLGWSTKYSNVVYRILPYIYLFLNLSMVFIIFRFVKVHYKNIQLVVKGLSLMTSFVIVSIKMTCLLKYRKEFFELHEILDFHFMDTLKRECLSHLVLNNLAIYQLLSWNLIVPVFVCTIFFNFMPLKTIILNHLNHIQPDHYILPYPSAFFWPVPFTGLVYRLHFLFESLASWVMLVLTAGYDSIFIFFVFLMIGKLREISYSLTHIDEKSDSNIIVKRCVSQYCVLLKCRDNLQKLFGPVILCMMATNAIVLCTQMYQMTQMKSLTILKAVLFFLYIHIKLVQTYMYSWCGTHLSMESDAYRNAVYATNWYGDKRFMTAIMIMLQQRPLVLTACNFSIVSIDIFIKILNTTISYYFLLKTLE